MAQTKLTPDAALQELLDGNRSFVGNQLTLCQDNLAALRKDTSQKQAPFAAILSCADSRDPVELIFDQSIGDLFVARVAGNIATPDVFATLEFGAAILGTKVILVMGHSHCGAVTATLAGKPVPGQISALFAAIEPAVTRAGGNLDAAIKENAKIQANLLATASPLLAGLIKNGALKILPAYYAIDTGTVTLLS